MPLDDSVEREANAYMVSRLGVSQGKRFVDNACMTDSNKHISLGAYSEWQ